MSPSELAELSANILMQYYDNQIEPFFDHCRDDIFWIGPAQNQIIHTKESLLRAFSRETHNLHFAVYNLTVLPLSASRQSTEVLLFFSVETFWPDGSSNLVDQRITLTWDSRSDPPQILLCHISNAIAYDARDVIYPVHYLKDHPQSTFLNAPAEKICFNGIKKSILYANPEEILYMESNGVHTQVHTVSQVFECTERLSSIGKRLEGTLLRCHSSFLVNPMYVETIERFSLTLKNGKKIPVPEKKYTAVKAALFSRQGKKGQMESASSRT